MRNMCVILYKASVFICLFSKRRVINIEHNSSYIVCFTLYTIIVAVSIKIPTVFNSRDAQKICDMESKITVKLMHSGPIISGVPSDN